MSSFFAFLLNSLGGGCIILGLGLIILLNEAVGEAAGGAGIFIALGVYVILKQFQSKKQ